jgi:radical SAM superfamily enzyme YgiQ (UPF0313 family)
MRLRFIYPSFQRHAESHPELLSCVPANEYLGPPSLGIAFLAAVTPPEWEIDFRDDRVEDVGLDDPVDLVAFSFFTAAASRALELADAFRARGRRVVLGGIFPSMMPEEAAAHADAIAVGEGESIWPTILKDAAAGELKAVYRGSAPCSLEQLPLPRVNLYMEKEGRRFCPDDYPVQISRGCPFACSACVLPSVMGKTLRHFPLDHALGQIEQLEARGKLASFTEDTSFFFGSGALKHFGQLLDGLAERGRDAAVSYIGVSMPLILVTKDAFFQRMRRAGIKMFYLVGGFDPITQGAFTGNDPKAWQRACDAIAKCFDHGIEPYTSFLVGNDLDDEGCFDRILEFADTTGIHKAEFAIRTPYPGTPSWLELKQQGRILHRDWSRYNDANVVFKPRLMTPERLQQGYLYLWREFYRSRQQIKDLGYRERTIQF